MINLSDKIIFEEVYRQYFVALKYFASHYLKDERQACDLLQDVFIRLWEKGDKFENQFQLKTYLYRVVRNQCLSEIRDTQRRMNQLKGFVPEETENAFIYDMMEAEIYAIINHAFTELPEGCRNVYMKSLEGKSHKEIAAELHIAITTIKKHKTLANHYLKKRLQNLIYLLTLI